ncbi:MAG TPA: FtsW/RodA/SpoVE family cell cycle protein, partial [Methylomirabilota bacterium]|nr:FtsW/RodA/SpoVE family cell cycle protein [Methylomirabilota bacterium]
MVLIDRRLLQNVDWSLLAGTVVLVSLSAATLSSLSVGRAGGGIALRQLLWFAVGVVALVVVASIDYRRLVRLAPVFYLLGLAILASVFALGRTVSGARRWIVLGPVSVQPSELFKLCFVLTCVWLLTSRWGQPVGRLTVVLAVPILAVPAVLIVKQPDLGTALLLLPVLVILLVGAGIPMRLLGGCTVAGVSAMPLAWLALR